MIEMVTLVDGKKIRRSEGRLGAYGIRIERVGFEERLVDRHLFDFAGGIAAERAELAHHVFDVVAAALMDFAAFGIDAEDAFELTVFLELIFVFEVTLEIFEGFGSDIVEAERDFVVSLITLQGAIDDMIMAFAVVGYRVLGDEVVEDGEERG